MDNSEEICAICREDKCDFETRCGHLFHEECLKIAVFSKNSSICPYCRGEISSIKLLERLFRINEDFENISFGPGNIGELKQMVKHGLVKKNLPLDLIAQKMVDLGWDIDELDFWLDQSKKPTKQSLFYASYYSGRWSLTYKLMKLGCKLVREDGYESVIPRAVGFNDIAFIEKLLGLGVDINSIDSTKSAFHVACDTNNVGMIDFLLENGAKITGYKRETSVYLDYKIGFGNDNRYLFVLNPLISACYYGSINAIRRLHYHFPSIFMNNCVSWQTFAIAIIKGNIALIDALIELGANIKAVDSMYGRNLFMIACAMKNIKVIKHVLEKGEFDINAQDSLGYSAILYPHAPEVFKFLIEKGADQLAKTRDENYTILHIACENSNYDLVKYVLDGTAFSKMSLKDIPRAKKGLIESCFSRIFDNSEIIVDLLLQRGADINEKNLDGETAFSKAYTYKCGIESLEFLLSRGADVNSVESDGMNFLHRILSISKLYYQDDVLIMILVENGINLNSQDKNGWTALHYACQGRRNIQTIMYLLDNGARADIPNNEGEFAFDILVLLGLFPSIEKFEELGLNYSKYIPNSLRAQPCDNCNLDFASVETRCSHFLHIHCMEPKDTCPLCYTRVSLSNIVEKMVFEERDYKDLTTLTDQQLFILLENYIEDEFICDFNTITNELKRRYETKPNFIISNSSYPNGIYPKACAYGRLKLLKFFDSLDICTVDPDFQFFAVSYATVSGNCEIIEYLMNKFGPECINSSLHEFYPIGIACMSRNVEILDFLIEKGAKTKIRSYDADLLAFAASFGSIEIIKRLVEKYGFVPDDMWKLFENIICYSGLYSMFREHPYRYPIIELINFPEKTEDEMIEMTKYFLDRGASIDCCHEHSKESLLSLAATYGCEKLFNFLIDYSLNVLKKQIIMSKHPLTVIAIAESGINFNLLDSIIKMGADVNWADRLGYTALMAACKYGHDKMCSRLIELGAHVNAKEPDDLATALHYACERSHDNVKCVETLLENGADIGARAKYDVSVLHFAVESCYLNIVKKLLSIGFDPNCVNDGLHTPLHYIFNSDHDEDLMLEVAKALVEAGANIYAEDESGETPFDIADRCIKYRKLTKYFNSLPKS